MTLAFFRVMNMIGFQISFEQQEECLEYLNASFTYWMKTCFLMLPNNYRQTFRLWYIIFYLCVPFLLAAIAELVDNAVDEVWVKSKIIYSFLGKEIVLVIHHEKNYSWTCVVAFQCFPGWLYSISTLVYQHELAHLAEGKRIRICIPHVLEFLIPFQLIVIPSYPWAIWVAYKDMKKKSNL